MQRGNTLTLPYPLTRENDSSGVSWSVYCNDDITLSLDFTSDVSVDFVTD